MQIIEHFIQGKRHNAQLCEDGWVVTPHFAAVVDGSTSKVAGRNGGRMAMELVCKALHTLPPLADKATMLHHLTAVFAAHNVPQAATKAEYRLTCSAGHLQCSAPCGVAGGRLLMPFWRNHLHTQQISRRHTDRRTLSCRAIPVGAWTHRGRHHGQRPWPRHNIRCTA